MASTSTARRRRAAAEDDGSSAGKTVGSRRNPRPTPYDRNPSPNWLTGVVLPKIASGAATLISSFISTPHDSSSSSSSSAESRDGSLADGSDESTYSLYFIDGVDVLNKENGSTPKFDECLRNESQLTFGKSETKHLIEKLIMQETFSREERDNLMGIINSRVIHGSTRDEGLVTRSDIPDLCTKAIKEAKQWIEEKKEASSSKLQQAHGISTLNSVMLSQDTKGGLGSPVDMATAYMRDHPPWSSPLLNSVGEKTQSRVGMEVLKDEAPCIGSFSSLKRKFSSGSWSIQDEIRKVRSKATEDMLKTLSSRKNNLSSFSHELEGIGNTLLNDRIDRGDGLRDSNLFPSLKLVNTSSNLITAGVGTSGCLPASAVDTTQDNIQMKDLQSQPVIRAQIQGVENILMVEEDKRAADGSRVSAIPEPIPKDDDKKPNAVCSSRDKLVGSDHREERCGLLSETSVEIPGIDEVDVVAIDNSLRNSTKHTKKSSKQLSPPKNLKQCVKGRTSARVGIGESRKLRPKGRAT